MYLGHLIFLAGPLSRSISWLARGIVCVHARGSTGACARTKRASALIFGDRYREYLARVKRWILVFFDRRRAQILHRKRSARQSGTPIGPEHGARRTRRRCREHGGMESA